MNDVKHVLCYSGGHSSAISAIEVVRKYGKENCILVNHECIHEPSDVGRFEKEVAAYLEMPITYVSMEGADTRDQFDVCIDRKCFVNVNSKSREVLCTHFMKTEPFMRWLEETFPDKDCICYYGFDKKEKARVQRRSGIMGAMGYKTGFPLWWMWVDRSIWSTREIGIEPPNSYEIFKHANCVGCLKAGWQHWYCVYVYRPDLYEKGKLSENIIGYSIHADFFLYEMEEKFDKMIASGIEATERIKSQTFWANVRAVLRDFDEISTCDLEKPCECFA